MESDDNFEIESPVKVTKKRSGEQILLISSDEEADTEEAETDKQKEEHENVPDKSIKGEFQDMLIFE